MVGSIKNWVGTVAAVGALFLGQAQVNRTEPSNGPAVNNPQCYAFTNAVVHVNGTTEIQQATLIIEKDRITACGTKIPVPAHAVLVDLKGAHVYPSFIDLYTSYVIKTEIPQAGGGGPQYQSKNSGAVHWNESIHPEKKAVQEFTPAADEAKACAKRDLVHYLRIGKMELCVVPALWLR